MIDDKKVTPIRRVEGSSPQSATLPVARKISNTEMISPRARLERSVINCVQTTIDTLREAARCESEGDEESAGKLRAAARATFDGASQGVEQLEGL